MTHGIVIRIQNEWINGLYTYTLGLETPDGKRTCLPVGLTCKAGDVLAVLTQAEWRLIEAYRNNVKPKQEIEA